MSHLSGVAGSEIDPARAGRRSSTLADTSSPGPSRAVGEVRARQATLAVMMALVLGVGCVLRLIAAGTLTPHVDEASSVLAAHAVASQGVPILSSGTVYFQSATLSYLLAPFVWLGVGGLEHLELMRLVLVVAGTLTVYLGYRLGRAVTGDSRVGIVTAVFVAIDPISVQWSGHVRMYGLLQALTAGLAWAFIVLLTEGRSWGRAALVTALFWAAVFTHVGASLLAPRCCWRHGWCFERHCSSGGTCLGAWR